MKFIIRGRKVEVTKSIKSYIEEKLGKLDKYFSNPDEITATVLIKIKDVDQIVEVTIPVTKMILRAEESNKELYAAIDLVVDKLERQIRKNKSRLNKKKIRENLIDLNLKFETTDLEENKGKIVKHKEIEGKNVRVCAKCGASLDKEFVKATKKDAKKAVKETKKTKKEDKGEKE